MIIKILRTITLITTYNDEDYLKCNDNLNNSHFFHTKLDSFDLYDLNNYVYQTSFLDNYRLITIIPINLLINLSIILLIIILIDCILILLTIIGGKNWLTMLLMN